MFKKRDNIKEVEEGKYLAPKFDKNGLIPVITTDINSGGILMHGYMNVKALKKTNPITTTSGSATITVHHRNHGMHSTTNNVTIAGVASGDHNGIAHSNINGTYTAIGNIKFDSYTVTAQNSDTASASGDIGSTTVTATRNIMYDVLQPVVGFIQPPGTTLTSTKIGRAHV